MSAILIITRLTFREAVRRRIVLAALLLGLAFLTVYSLGFHFVHAEMREPGDSGPMPALMREQAYNFLLMAGLYAANFLGIAMSALITADTLAGEIASGTVQTLVTKPMRRSDLVVGKWLGLAGLLLLYGALMVGGVMASVYLQSGYHAPHLARGMALIFLNSLLIMTVTLACSSSLSTLATGGVVFGLYGVAFVGGWVEQIGAILQNETAIKVGILSSLILPSEALWKRAAHEMSPPLTQILFGSPFSSPSVPSPLMVAYACGYLVVALVLALRWFGGRDL